MAMSFARCARIALSCIPHLFSRDEMLGQHSRSSLDMSAKARATILVPDGRLVFQTSEQMWTLILRTKCEGCVIPRLSWHISRTTQSWRHPSQQTHRQSKANCTPDTLTEQGIPQDGVHSYGTPGTRSPIGNLNTPMEASRHKEEDDGHPCSHPSFHTCGMHSCLAEEFRDALAASDCPEVVQTIFEIYPSCEESVEGTKNPETAPPRLEPAPVTRQTTTARSQGSVFERIHGTGFYRRVPIAGAFAHREFTLLSLQDRVTFWVS